MSKAKRIKLNTYTIQYRQTFEAKILLEIEAKDEKEAKKLARERADSISDPSGGDGMAEIWPDGVADDFIVTAAIDEEGNDVDE